MLAYIDGTTGGMMLQILGGGVVGVAVFLKFAAGSLISSLWRRKPQEKEELSQAEPILSELKVETK